MSIKRNLTIGVLTAALGFSLISGGTIAYFNNTEATANTFASGVLDLGINKSSIIKIDKIVPGDTINGHFELTNDGSVDMKEVKLLSSYEVGDKGKSNNGDDLGDHIVVEYLQDVNGKETVLVKEKLSNLKGNPTKILDEFPVDSKPKKFTVRFSFVDNGQEQNHFQGDSLELKWEFEAIQRDGNPNFVN